MTTQADKAQTLARLHSAPEILRVVNVWDAVSAKTIAALPETRAIATAGHSIAATFGYADGENIPLDLMLDMVGRIVEAVGTAAWAYQVGDEEFEAQGHRMIATLLGED